MTTDLRDADQWIEKAALYELFALSWLFVTDELIEALGTGEFSEAFEEIAKVNGYGDETIESIVSTLSSYRNIDTKKIKHELRVDYTRLFIGAPDPLVAPYEGMWKGKLQGINTLMFVNKEALEVEEFMGNYGVKRAADTNEPLDHIGSELEFLKYLCLVKANVVPALEGVEIPAGAYDEFVKHHVITWMVGFSEEVLKESRTPFYTVMAKALNVHLKAQNVQ